MSNKELAAKIVHHMTGDLQRAHDVAEELAAAGLITPDLPKPDEADFVPDGKGWLPGGPHGPSIWTAPDSTVMVQRIEPGDLTPEEARGIADALYAAANYSEEGTQK